MPNVINFKISMVRRKIVLFTLLLLLPLAVSSCSKATEAKPGAKKATNSKIDYFAWDAPRSISVNGTEYVLIDDYVKFVPTLYRDRDFASIEQHISSLLAEHNEGSANKLNVLYSVLAHITDLSHRDLMESVISEWCQQSESHIPWIVRGYFHITAGWEIRGSGWGSTVSPEAKRQFKEQLALAQSDFEKAYTLNPNDPNSSSGLLIVARALGLPDEEMETFFQRGIGVSPGHFDLYRQKHECLTPKWGGTVEEMLEFAGQCQSLGGQYPSVGLVAIEALVEVHKHFAPKEENFLGKEATWDIVKKSHERFFAMYPDDILRRFYYAYYALRAEKFQTAIEQFEIIGDRWHFGLCWSSPESFNRGRARAYYNLGIGLYEKKLPGVAVGYLQTAVEYNPTGIYYHSLALAQWGEAQSTGNLHWWKEAERSLIKAIELDPELESAKGNLKTLQDYLKTIDRA